MSTPGEPPPFTSNVKFLALFCAVLHHGLANLASADTVPSRSDTVMNTALDFEDYLNDVPVNEWRTRPRPKR